MNSTVSVRVWVGFGWFRLGYVGLVKIKL